MARLQAMDKGGASRFWLDDKGVAARFQSIVQEGANRDEQKTSDGSSRFDA